MQIEKLRSEHKLLTEFKYDLQPIEKGYANRTLYINLSENHIESQVILN